ncbi:MAG TPA: alpha/beta fold hydrolase [Thermoleophilaceae bacterium]
MKHPVPAPPTELSAHDGLAYALFLPDTTPSAGVVVLHGAGSAKENHFDFARAARGFGLAALAFDARGHGESEGEFGPGCIADVMTMCTLLREHVARVAVRGSSMGGFKAIFAAAESHGEIGAVIAICPAPPSQLLRGIRSGSLSSFRMDRSALEEWLPKLDIEAAAASLAPETALLLMHAEGDESVPYTVSQEIYAAAGRPKQLLLLPGGHHRSIQHDDELQAESLRFIEKRLTSR